MQTPEVDVAPVDSDGICLFLGPEAFVTWEDLVCHPTIYPVSYSAFPFLTKHATRFGRSMIRKSAVA